MPGGRSGAQTRQHIQCPCEVCTHTQLRQYDGPQRQIVLLRIQQSRVPGRHRIPQSVCGSPGHTAMPGLATAQDMNNERSRRQTGLAPRKYFLTQHEPTALWIPGAGVRDRTKRLPTSPNRQGDEDEHHTQPRRPHGPDRTCRPEGGTTDASANDETARTRMRHPANVRPADPVRGGIPEDVLAQRQKTSGGFATAFGQSPHCR